MSVDEYFKTGLQLQSMSAHTEWIVQNLIPKGGITDLSGRAGIGKTMLVLNLEDAVSRGEPFLGLATMQMPVYHVSYEDPLEVMADRVRMLGITGVNFCLSSFDPSPPRLDTVSFDYIISELPPGLVVIDSLRSAQSGSENDSKDMTAAMDRLKSVRNAGHTIILIVHTKKSNEQVFRGSQSIQDQCDHELQFYALKSKKSKKTKKDERETDEPETDNDESDGDFGDSLFFLGTSPKSRYGQFKMYLKRAGDGRFVAVSDPDTDRINRMTTILSPELNKTAFLEAIKQLGIGKARAEKLLLRGERDGKWTTTRGENNALIYHRVYTVCPLVPILFT